MFFIMPSKKKCTKCGLEKEFSLYYKDKGTKSGLGSRCKDCVKKCAKESQNNNKKYRKEYLSKYNKNNKEKILEVKRKYREDNKEYFREYMKNYTVERRKRDKLFRLTHNVRNRMWSAFNNNNWKKQGSKKLLGGTYIDVLSHIESLFQEGMSWDNYGRCKSGECHEYWHIDHIIPLNRASTKKGLEELCHYTNLQPLWAFDNLSKNKF